MRAAIETGSGAYPAIIAAGKAILGTGHLSAREILV
jgi:hypothetical protein